MGQRRHPLCGARHPRVRTTGRLGRNRLFRGRCGTQRAGRRSQSWATLGPHLFETTGDAIVFSEVLSYFTVQEAVAEVRRYAQALSPEGIVAVSMMNDGKSRAIWRALRQEFRWIDGILWQQKEPWPSYRISVSRGHPGYLVGVLGLRHELGRPPERVSLT